MSISFSVSTAKPASVKADLLIVLLDEALSLPASLPKALQKEIATRLQRISFKGAWSSAELFVVDSSSAQRFIAVAGFGGTNTAPTRQAEGIRRAVATIIHDARKHMLHHVAVAVPDVPHAADLAAAACEAVELANYRFSDHLPRLATEQKERSIRRVTLLVASSHSQTVKSAVHRTQAILKGVAFTRDLVNQPASHVTPAVLVRHARAMAADSPLIRIKVLNRAQAQRQRFTAFLAVARGSKEEPYVIHLIYKPKGKVKKKVVLVGKGVTFDSGGLSLKPAPNMETMKIDMGGAATVLGVFAVLPAIRPNIEVHGVIAACENMPSGDAYRPGDVLTARNGKTIEVLNTDAEGRITLADALSYAADLKPNVIIDTATLTGASMVALGDTHAGLWSNNGQLRDKLLAAAQKTGEGLVALPLPDEYRQTIQSKVADVRNVATMERMGGAITAALFLQEFVGNTPWAHIDLAGPVYAERPLLPYYPYGATGYGVRMLVEFLR